jgi:hypothetical protein
MRNGYHWVNIPSEYGWEVIFVRQKGDGTSEYSQTGVKGYRPLPDPKISEIGSFLPPPKDIL